VGGGGGGGGDDSTNNSCCWTSIYPLCVYDDDDDDDSLHQDSYIDQLLSIKTDDGYKSKRFWFEYWLLSVIIYYSREHKPIFMDLDVGEPILKKCDTFYQDGSNIKTDVDCIKMYINYGITKCFQLNEYDNNYKFKILLIHMFLEICFSMNFYKESILELINSFTLIWSTYNHLKKIIIYYGQPNSGKSHFLKILSDLVEPLYAAFINLTKAFERSNITQQKHIIVINEISEIESTLYKMISGNDKNSETKFFHQDYSNSNRSQGILYGATNNIIKFKQADPYSIDKASISRLHCINFVSSINSEPSSYKSLIKIIGSKEYFQSLSPLNSTNRSEMMGWLSYITYVKNRDKNSFSPTLNIKSSDSIDYKHKTFEKNNNIYRQLNLLGLVDSEDFLTSEATIRNLVFKNPDVVAVKNKTVEGTVNMFISEISTIYPIKKVINIYFQNLIPNSYLLAFKIMLNTIPTKNFNITKQDLENRVNSLYNTKELKTNAYIYFKKYNHKYLNLVTKVYENVAFEVINVPNEISYKDDDDDEEIPALNYLNEDLI